MVFIQPLTTKRYRISDDWTVTPTVFNRILVFHNRLDNPLSDANDGVDGAAIYGIKGLSLNNYPVINFGGGPVYSLSQKTSFIHQYHSATTWGYSDTVSFASGKHFMKAGFEARRQFQDSVPTPAATFNFSNLSTSIPQEQSAITSFTGYSFATYLLGGVTSGTLMVRAPRTEERLRRSVPAG